MRRVAGAIGMRRVVAVAGLRRVAVEEEAGLRRAVVAVEVRPLAEAENGVDRP